MLTMKIKQLALQLVYKQRTNVWEEKESTFTATYKATIQHFETPT